MSDRRRSAPLVLVTLVLMLLLPGLSLAAGERLHTPAAEESAFSALLDWAARAWEALTGRSPEARSPLGHVAERAGCGIDPNGTCTGGGGGTTNSTGH